jgi:hypothetical protein
LTNMAPFKMTTNGLQMHRLAGNTNANRQAMGLQVNGVEVAQCNQCESNIHPFTIQSSFQIHELMSLGANDILQVRRCGAVRYSDTAVANRFTILYLGN